MLPLASTPRSKIGAFLIPSRGIEMYATTSLGPAPVLWVLGRNFGCWWGGDSGSLSAGIGWVATSGEPRWTRPLAGRAVAISARPIAISSPAIKFRRIAPIIVRRNREPVKKRTGRRPSRVGREGAGQDRRPACRTVCLGGLAGGLADVGLANGLRERPARLLGSRPGLQHDRLAGKGVGAFPCLASLDVTRRERADLGEAHAHSTGSGRDGRLEGVLDGPAKVRFLDLVTLLGEILVHQADERRRGPFLGFRHRVLRLVNPLGQSPVVGCKRARGRKRALFRRNCQKMCRDARTAV